MTATRRMQPFSDLRHPEEQAHRTPTRFATRNQVPLGYAAGCMLHSQRLLPAIHMSHRKVTLQKLTTLAHISLLVLAYPALLAAKPTAKTADPAELPLTPVNAAAYFAEAAHDCHADDGKLWGISTCGPILFVDPTTHVVIASKADANGKLKTSGHGTFSGTMPKEQPVANTSVGWSGTRWIEVLWPLPTDTAKRRTLLAHESYHFIQDQVIPISRHGDNSQLDVLYGRYTLRLEWRALAAALNATSDAARRQASDDALLFRAARYRRFPDAQASEVALERNEGLAEYTGVMIGNATTAQRKTMALADLRGQAKNPSFVRSFAYATGPAYGLLLDRYRHDWRKQIVHSPQGPAAMLATALHLDLAHMPIANVAARATHYDGAALLAAETARQAKHDKLIAHYRASLVDGPVLTLPLNHMQVQFDPRNVLALGKTGSIYPSIRVVDDWGSIDIEQGGLIDPNWHRLVVAAASTKPAKGTLHGNGWTLRLAPGWRLAAGTRKGDFVLEREGKAPASR